MRNILGLTKVKINLTNNSKANIIIKILWIRFKPTMILKTGQI